MATSASLEWQKQQIVASANSLEYDLRGAAEEAIRQGRPLTDSEFSGYRIDTGSSITPIKRLVYIGDSLKAVA